MYNSGILMANKSTWKDAKSLTVIPNANGNTVIYHSTSIITGSNIEYSDGFKDVPKEAMILKESVYRKG